MLVAGARPAAAQPAASSSFAGRGPLETREEWLLAQPHLTLPALSPDPLPDGALARLGVRKPDAVTELDLHQGLFDADERAISVGVRVLVAAVLLSF